MSDPIPPIPIDTNGIDEPLPDDGHEAIRVAVLAAIQTVWIGHSQLVDAVGVTQADLASARADLAAAQQIIADQATAIDGLTTAVTDLQAAVTALQTPPTPEGA